MHCNIRTIAVALATLSLLTLGACTTTDTASGGAGRFTPQQPPAEPWPAHDTGTQMGTD